MVAPPIRRVFSTMTGEGKRGVVLGSGRGHEARAAECGYDVVAVDFAPQATSEARRLTSPELANHITWRAQDLFTLAETDPGAFDLVVEHTSFCAIGPSRRREWVRVAHATLRPGGELLGLFFAHPRFGGPPYGATHGDVLAMLTEGGFAIEHHEVPTDSIERRRSEELLVRARR
jgi:cyclopropane fatty-acyl-phospholipid synthase-like methyltransferase